MAFRNYHWGSACNNWGNRLCATSMELPWGANPDLDQGKWNSFKWNVGKYEERKPKPRWFLKEIQVNMW